MSRLSASSSAIPTTAMSIINSNTVTELKKFQGEINTIVNIVLAFALASSVLIFIIHFVRLAAAPNQPAARSKILRDIGTTAIIVAILGSIGLVGKIVLGIFL